MTDTKTLVVGEKVNLSCGEYRCMGEVVRVMSDGFEVRTDNKVWLKFDNHGKGYTTEPTFECNGPWNIAYKQ